jgi:hypothetical protein
MADKQNFPYQEMAYLKERIESPTCLVVTSYGGYFAWLKACLKSYQGLKMFTILCYDGPGTPPSQFSKLVNMVIVKPFSHATLNYSSLIQWKLALPIIEELGFENVFVLCGDNYIEKPEGFPELIKKLNGYDILPYWSDGKINNGGGRIGTMAWICSVKNWRKILDKVSDIWYKHPSGGKVEEKVSKAAHSLGLKVAPVMENGSFDFRLVPDGWNGIEKQNRGIFGELIGLRHIHREIQLRKAQKLEPIDESFLDRSFKHPLL